MQRFFSKCAALDQYLRDGLKEPKILDLATGYFKPGMTCKEKEAEALQLEESLDQAMIILGLKEYC